MHPTSQKASIITMALALLLPIIPAASAAASQKGSAERANDRPHLSATAFAPVGTQHPLSELWNDPDFIRRLGASYGFLADVEPRMTPEEQQFYNEKVKPQLQGDRTKAVSLLQSRVKPQSSAQFDYLLGTLHFEQGDLTNAVAHFERALLKFPDFRRAQKNLGFALVRDGKYEQSIQPLTRTIALGGADGKVFGLLGFAYANLGRHVSAEGAYQQAMVFEPENANFKLGLIKSAIATANYDRALALLDELLAQDPGRGSLWTLHANLHIQREQPAKAAVSLEMLRRLGGATPQDLFLLGDLHMTQGANELALSAYLAAVEKDAGQNPSKALRPLQILVSRGAWDEAKVLLAKTRAVGSGLSDTDELRLLKLESKIELAVGSPDRAIETLEKILNRNPLDGEALLLSGDFYARSGQSEKAEFRFDAASKLDAFQADALVKQAQLLVEGRKYVRAVELLKLAQKAKARDNVQRYLEKVEQLAMAARP